MVGLAKHTRYLVVEAPKTLYRGRHRNCTCQHVERADSKGRVWKYRYQSFGCPAHGDGRDEEDRWTV
jgi:hypothetical protein